MPVIKDHYAIIPTGSHKSLPMQDQASIKKQEKIPLMVRVSWTPLISGPETQEDLQRDENAVKAVCAVLEKSPWYEPLNCGDSPQAKQAKHLLKNSAAQDTVPWHYISVSFKHRVWSYDSFWPRPTWALLLPIWMPTQPVEIYSVLNMNFLVQDSHRNYLLRYNSSEESRDKYFWYGMWNTSEKLENHLNLSMHSLLQQLYETLERNNTAAPDTRWTEK